MKCKMPHFSKCFKKLKCHKKPKCYPKYPKHCKMPPSKPCFDLTTALAREPLGIGAAQRFMSKC